MKKCYQRAASPGPGATHRRGASPRGPPEWSSPGRDKGEQMDSAAAQRQEPWDQSVHPGWKPPLASLVLGCGPSAADPDEQHQACYRRFFYAGPFWALTFCHTCRLHWHLLHASWGHSRSWHNSNALSAVVTGKLVRGLGQPCCVRGDHVGTVRHAAVSVAKPKEECTTDVWRTGQHWFSLS